MALLFAPRRIDDPPTEAKPQIYPAIHHKFLQEFVTNLHNTLAQAPEKG
jgi:hypothetical protein